MQTQGRTPRFPAPLPPTVKGAVVVYSGGMDSTVLLYYLAEKLGPSNVKCLSINYGQRHGVELGVASTLARERGVEHRAVDLTSLRPLMGGSSQTDDQVPVPEGHYAEESMKLTVVPNRNMILLAVAAAWAISLKFDAIAYAAHSGDHAVYPDCREEFTTAFAACLGLCDWTPPVLLRPFVGFTKGEVCALGADLVVPMERTWSCYKGAEVFPKHCGKCGTCVERREAFQTAGVTDLTQYAE